MKRWLYVIVGDIILLFVSLIYAWSVLSIPIAAEFKEWTTVQLSWTFTLVMIMFCLGGFVGSLLSYKIPVKFNIWFSAILFLIGFILVAKTQNITMLYLGFGVFGGFASGLTYNAVNGTVSKWFPDKQGLVSGILLMGFGLGSFIIGKVYQAYTPTEIGGWRTSFYVLAGILFILLFIGGFFIKKPNKDFIEKLQKIKTPKTLKEGLDIPANQMIKRPSFWIFFIWCIVLSASGLALVSQASHIIGEVSQTVSSGSVATIVGLISIFNGLGRVMTGAIFDKKGRKITIVLVNVLYIIFILLNIAAILSGSLTILIMGFIVGGISYGSVISTNAAYINSSYGPTYYSINFSISTLNLIFASFGSTIAGAIYDATGSYMNLFLILLCAVIIVFGGTFFIKKP